MHFKKLLVFLTVILFLSACSKTMDTVKAVDGFDIQFISAKQLDSDGEKIVQLNFTVKNKTADMQSFDSFVFLAENKEGAQLKIAPKENFGSDLQPGEEKEGSIYYYLEGDAPLLITYDNPDSEEKETWKIKSIEK